MAFIYINRGLFVSAPDIETVSTETFGRGEINSLLEWIIAAIEGQENDIDEDGDFQGNCIFVKVVNPATDPQCLLTDMEKPTLVVHRRFAAFNETIRPFLLYNSIDKPPELRG